MKYYFLAVLFLLASCICSAYWSDETSQALYKIERESALREKTGLDLRIMHIKGEEYDEFLVLSSLYTRIGHTYSSFKILKGSENIKILENKVIMQKVVIGVDNPWGKSKVTYLCFQDTDAYHYYVEGRDDAKILDKFKVKAVKEYTNKGDLIDIK